MNYFLNMAVFLLFSASAIADDFELIKKSAYASNREDFESVLGDLTKFDYILIYPDNAQISVVSVSKDNKITRKYWRSGIPKEQIMVRNFDEKNLLELKAAIEKIFITYEKDSEKPSEKGQLNLYRKAADDFSWRCVRFKPGLKDQEFKILYKIMIPDEDKPDPKDVEEFLRDK